MNKYIKILKNEYYDSVTLMSLTAKLKSEIDVEELVVLMATEMNKELIASIGLSTDEVKNATQNDCVIAVVTKMDAEKIVEQVIEQLKQGDKQKKQKNELSYSTQKAALKEYDANIAVISVPGEYAAREAKIALNNNLHVMLFSDNVSLEDEISLKKLAKDKGLLLMGPDCGTSIINHKGLCFANSIKEGSIGLVAASGTGLQEVTVIIDRLGGGISQAIGVGGRDLKDEVGGIMMIEGIKALNRDENTRVIVLVSKPPSNKVQEKILTCLEDVQKPVVICFLDGEKKENKEKQYFVNTLEEAAVKAVELLGIKVKIDKAISEELEKIINEEKAKLLPTQKYVRGLYCGGTLCLEALSVSRKYLSSVYSNVASNPSEKMADVFTSTKNTFVDLGEDIFTKGKPHPMIEPTIRLERIIKEASDEETAVILLDFVLGYGAHEDPVGVTIETIKKAKKIAEENNRHLVFVSYVCGTDTDKQNYYKSVKRLKDEGVIVANTNHHAVLIAVNILKEGV